MSNVSLLRRLSNVEERGADYDRSREYARPIVHVGIDHGIWPIMGTDRMPFLRASRDESLLPG